jgi:4-phosphopantoate--beta-alanine ligase
MSRTARSADITMVDNIVRAMPLLVSNVRRLRKASPARLKGIVSSFDNRANLDRVLRRMLRNV